MGLFKEIQKTISPDILIQACLNTVPREDRYTYLDEFAFNKSSIIDLIERSHIYD
jgi:hypothetical protein